MHVLRSARLKLRPMSTADEGLYCRIYTDATLMRHVAPPMDAPAAQRSFLTACRLMSKDPPQIMLWVMEEIATGNDLGLVALMWRGEPDQAEIGTMILAQVHRTGFAFEAMSRVMAHAFGPLGLSGLWGHHPSSNAASTGLMARLGFVRAPPTQPHLDHRWELSREQWSKSAADR